MLISEREKLPIVAYLQTQGAWAGPTWFGDVLRSLRDKLRLPALLAKAGAGIAADSLDGKPKPVKLTPLESEVLMQTLKVVMSRADTPPALSALCLGVLDRV